MSASFFVGFKWILIYDVKSARGFWIEKKKLVEHMNGRYKFVCRDNWKKALKLTNFSINFGSRRQADCRL